MNRLAKESSFWNSSGMGVESRSTRHAVTALLRVKRLRRSSSLMEQFLQPLVQESVSHMEMAQGDTLFLPDQHANCDRLAHGALEVMYVKCKLFSGNIDAIAYCIAKACTSSLGPWLFCHGQGFERVGSHLVVFRGSQQAVQPF